MRDPVLKWKPSGNGGWSAISGRYELFAWHPLTDRTRWTLAVRTRSTAVTVTTLQRINVTDVVNELVRCEDLLLEWTESVVGKALWKLVTRA